MAGNKKKKTKPVANPARGFATTSLPSKPRVEASDAAESSAQTAPAADKDAPQSSQATAGGAPQTTTGGTGPGPEAAALSAEEFERQLEESELQLQVEKYAQKVRRDAQRQKNRLDTDRRLLRSSAEPLNIKKWLPPELVEQILDLIQLESRYASSGLVSEPATANKLSEEDLTIKLWTLQQTLILAGFSEERVQSVLQFILDIASSVSVSNKESIWGLEESLDWLARECPKEELPDYEARSRPKLKALPG